MSNLPITNLQGSTTRIDNDTLAALESQLRGTMIRPGDADYDEARQVWNAMIDKRPGLIIRCAGAADVIDAVRFAHDHQLLVAVKGCGHNSAGNAVCDGGLMIDLSLMKGVRVDIKAGTVRAEAGCNWGDVDRETQAFGMVTPGGVVSDTGIAGLTLGGGLSWMRRKWGMTIDNLRSVDLVTADGRFLTVSADENEDLFWAIRGGGGNFGIVTSFEYEMHALGPEVMFAATMYPVDQIKPVLEHWRAYMAQAPDEVTSDAIIWTVPEFEMFPPELHGKPFVMLAGLYAGSVEEGQQKLQPLREAATPLIDLSGVYPYRTVQQMFDPMLPKHTLLCYWKSTYLNGLSDAVIGRINDFGTDRPYPKALISIRGLGGALGRIEAGSTAFGDRSAPFLLSIDAIWDDPADTERCIAWARRFWNEMQRFSNGMTYFNFPGLLEEGDQMMRDSFGGNYKRLADLKAKYDPTNQFRLNQNIQPAVPA